MTMVGKIPLPIQHIYQFKEHTNLEVSNNNFGMLNSVNFYNIFFFFFVVAMQVNWFIKALINLSISSGLFVWTDCLLKISILLNYKTIFGRKTGMQRHNKEMKKKSVNL